MFGKRKREKAPNTPEMQKDDSPIFSIAWSTHYLLCVKFPYAFIKKCGKDRKLTSGFRLTDIFLQVFVSSFERGGGTKGVSNVH